MKRFLPFALFFCALAASLAALPFWLEGPSRGNAHDPKSPLYVFPHVTVLASNSTIYAVSMSMDGASYVNIPAGGQYSFSSPIPGSHVFSMQGVVGVGINNSACGLGFACASGNLSLGGSYVLLIAPGASGSCANDMDWACP